MRDDASKRPWSSAGTGRVGITEKEPGTIAHGFLWILRVVRWLPPLVVNRPKSEVTDLFCNIEPSLKGCQDLVCIVQCTPFIQENCGGFSYLLGHTCLPPTSSAPWCYLVSFSRREVLQPLQPVCASGWTLLALQPSRLRCKKLRGPWLCLKSPCALSSTILVVETIKTEPCQPRYRSLTMMLMSEQISSIE